MSVIFRSLQKLKAHAGEDHRPAVPFKNQRRARVQCNGRLADLRIASLVVLVCLSGIGTSYGVYKIRSHPPNILKADDATGRTLSAMDLRPKPAAAWIPKKDETLPRCDIRYFPALIKSDDGRDGAPMRAAAISRQPAASSGLGRLGGTAAAKSALAAAARPPAAVNRRPSDDDQRVDERREQPAGRVKTSAQNMAQQNVNRSLEINRVVNEIRSCMTAADCRQIDSLFDRLQALKGAHNPYVLKLKGYWHLQQDRFESAIGLLQKVLIHDENDLEANVNMAIAEMRLNRRQRARHRLARLREIYPDNAKLAEVWEQLNK